LPQSRSSARRHRGSRKIRQYDDAPVVERLVTPGTNPRDAIRCWREELHHPPLFVYFIQDDRGPVKIGRAGDPLTRLSELQCGNPFKLTLRAVILAFTEDVEQRIHDMWRTAHVRGEWFGGGLEAEIIGRARQTQRQQIETMIACRADYSEVLEMPLEIMSQTGMRRG
jgi:hypothetical protein